MELLCHMQVNFEYFIVKSLILDGFNSNFFVEANICNFGEQTPPLFSLLSCLHRYCSFPAELQDPYLDLFLFHNIIPKILHQRTPEIHLHCVVDFINLWVSFSAFSVSFVKLFWTVLFLFFATLSRETPSVFLQSSLGFFPKQTLWMKKITTVILFTIQVTFAGVSIP